MSNPVSIFGLWIPYDMMVLPSISTKAMGMLKSALWGILSVMLAASIGCGNDSALEQSVAEDVAASYVRLEPSMTVLPASVEWPIPSPDDAPATAAGDDAPVAKTIYVDITWDENYNYVFDFDGPLTVPAGKKVRFIVTNTFTDPDECW